MADRKRRLRTFQWSRLALLTWTQAHWNESDKPVPAVPGVSLVRNSGYTRGLSQVIEELLE